MRRAKQQDPLSPFSNVAVATILMYQRRDPEAVREFQNVLELYPDFGVAHYGLGRTHAQAGRYDAAVTEFEKALARSPRSPHVIADLAQVHAQAGRRKEAEAYLKRWQQLGDESVWKHEQAARVYAALGDREKAFALLERALQERSPLLAFLKVDPRFDSLRADKRFDRILGRLGLPPV